MVTNGEKQNANIMEWYKELGSWNAGLTLDWL